MNAQLQSNEHFFPKMTVKKERGEVPLEKDRFIIPKSRYASVSSYLCDENQKYNDMKLVVDEHSEKILLEAGMDPVLANHFAHLWIRPVDTEREVHICFFSV